MRYKVNLGYKVCYKEQDSNHYIRQLVQKVVLYDDKVEIYFKYTKKPDDNSRASLIFKGNYLIISSSSKYTKHKVKLENDIVSNYTRECYI